jgi:hypothetical protein
MSKKRVTNNIKNKNKDIMRDPAETKMIIVCY